MAKHTPGPWEVFTEDRFSGWWAIRQVKSAHEVGSGDGGFDEADARLIAAAPEILEALQDMVNDITERFDMDSPSTNPGIKICVENAVAAIAKATGQCLKGEK